MWFGLRFFFRFNFQECDTVAESASRRKNLIKDLSFARARAKPEIKDLSPRARRRQTLIKDLSEKSFHSFLIH